MSVRAWLAGVVPAVLFVISGAAEPPWASMLFGALGGAALLVFRELAWMQAVREHARFLLWLLAKHPEQLKETLEEDAEG